MSFRTGLGVLACGVACVGSVSAWNNGQTGNTGTDTKAESSHPPYATHDFIADHALDLLAPAERAWLVPHKSLYLIGNSGATKMTNDRPALRAQEEYDKAVVAVGQAIAPGEADPPAWRTVTLVDQRKAIDDLLFSDDGKVLAAVSRDGAIVLWNADTLQKILRIEKAHRSTASLAFSLDGSRLASWSRYEPRVKIWESGTGKLLGELGDSQAKRSVQTVAFSGDGRTLAVMTVEIDRPFAGLVTRNTSTSQTVLWDVSTLTALDTSLGPPGSIKGVAFSHDGKMLAAWDGKFLNVWDLTAKPPVSQSFAPHGHAIATAGFGSDDATLTVIDEGPVVTTWDVDTRMQRAQSEVEPARELSVVNFSPDGGLLALGGRDRSVTLLRTSSLQPQGAPFSGHPEPIAKIVFNADHRVLAAASPGYFRFWDIAAQAVIGTCDVRAVLAQRADEPWMIAMSSDGRQLATARSGDSKVVVCKAP